MPYEHILYDVSNRVATITLNRPEAMNALSPTLEDEMHAALDDANTEEDVRCIILTGAGRAFSAGFDIAPSEGRRSRLDPSGQQMGDFLKDRWDRDVTMSDRLLHLWRLGTPVIAAVNGWALGGGFWYTLACDITIAADNATFGQPEVRHISNTTFLFAALAGWKAAHRYSLTGDHFDAAEALRLGIINEIVPGDQLMSRARELAERIAMVPEPSVRLNKAVTCFGFMAMGLGSAMLVNDPLSVLVHSSHNADRDKLFAAMGQGGLRAFLEARDGPFQPEPFGPKSKKK
ncbi:MAG TPA: enoyl-CoA hydratase/isomerase family protein [Chloroflexota bacterium]|nr:enoyl-CoA hydratase/isomerase family protein [Chloroflexota bacterium]